MHGHRQLFTDPHLGRRGHQQGDGNTKRSRCLVSSQRFRLRQAESLIQVFVFVSPTAAFPKIHPTPELLEGQQRQQQREDGRADGAGASRGPVHRHPHRHGFQHSDVGGGEPSVRREQGAQRAKDGDIKDYDLFTPARLEARLCPAGQWRLTVLFIWLYIFQLYFYFLYGVECNHSIWDSRNKCSAVTFSGIEKPGRGGWGDSSGTRR